MFRHLAIIIACYTLVKAENVATPKGADSPVMIQCQFECVEISREDMIRLLFHGSQSLIASKELHDQLREMVKKDQAKVVETSLILACNGYRASAQSITQTDFPTDYIGGDISEFYKKNTPLRPQAMRLSELYRTPPTPENFTNRDLGATLQVEATWDKTAGHIVLKYTWQITDYLGQKNWVEYKDHAGTMQSVSMPLMFDKRLSATVTCEPGQPTWIGTMQPQLPDGKEDLSKKWLVFVKCEMQKLP